MLVAQEPVRRKLRAEHNEVLGNDLTGASATLIESPCLLNFLLYTSSVIKEPLRLHRAPMPLRDGQSHQEVVDRETTGDRYTTDGFILWDELRSQSRSEAFQARANEFVPERWATKDEGDPLHPKKHSWRIFGLGNRNCTGPELAMIEMKLMLVFLARETEIDWV
ncbi:Putative cytochrome P450 [Colletotrichum destructivum]|uniref:Cytochrome P450 n=1 Tax=Colletotrichum destructivum TaxID=34406 RepID=A0AAX4I6W0_9PEZI|nr:Putative cytochrome P450 [Colletotrichum destructivum]